MKPGRELDELIASKVMGLTISQIGLTDHIPHYSTNIAHAWKIVEKLKEKYWFTLHNDFTKHGDPKDYWFARFELKKYEAPYELFEASAETAPLAICLAALKVVESNG